MSLFGNDEIKQVVEKSELNKTLTMSDVEIEHYKKFLIYDDISDIVNKTMVGNSIDILPKIKSEIFNLVVADPPYNIDKKFKDFKFSSISEKEYMSWSDSWIKECYRTLKNNGSMYICCDWKTSQLLHSILKDYFFIQNRITWEREKGRGCKNNWKNNIEDIWFVTKSKNYYFNIDAVMIKRKVNFGYHNVDGSNRDWDVENGVKTRNTYPSNVWTDITIPFWSMIENTEHPTQKPEKLVAKLICASSQQGDFVFDPFLGSGTTSVVSKKLNRKYFGIELQEYYACLCEKRIDMSNSNAKIQGYENGIFLDRNINLK